MCNGVFSEKRFIIFTYFIFHTLDLNFNMEQLKIG
jgi:hypothetical protein